MYPGYMIYRNGLRLAWNLIGYRWDSGSIVFRGILADVLEVDDRVQLDWDVWVQSHGYPQRWLCV